MRREEAALVSSQTSQTYYADGVEPWLRRRLRAACNESTFYTAMLREDVRVVPSRLGAEDAGAITVDSPTPDRSTELIVEGLGSDPGRHSLEGAVRGFLNSLAQLIVVCGPVTYEIVYLRPAADPAGRPVGFRLAPIPSGSLGRRFRQPIQYVPRDRAQHVTLRGQGYVKLTAENLVTFHLDRRTERALHRTIHFLEVAGALQGRELELAKRSLAASTGYDFVGHRQAVGELIATSTSPVGWNVRDLYKDDRLEPYLVWRWLRFLEFQAVVRESLLVQTNRILEHVGARVGFQGSIEIAGLPSPSDVQRARQDLETGRRSLDELARFAVSGSDA
jgi:hypothetical protein